MLTVFIIGIAGMMGTWYYAKSQCLPPTRYMIVAFFLWPVALFFVYLNRRKCPYCVKGIPALARICSYCQKDVARWARVEM